MAFRSRKSALQQCSWQVLDDLAFCTQRYPRLTELASQVVEHQTSLIGACHADAGHMGAGVTPILTAVCQQLRWALQQPVSMARWHRGEA